ncbi:MAG TPA: hypothetical protein VE978_12835 [Chitinophagales bacterium]|nr:hypothetical protein [Chitinophagales bacterium]
MQKTIIILFLLTFNLCSSLCAQDTILKLIKVGVKGSFGTDFKNELTNLADQWIDNTAEVSNVELSSNVISLPFSFEYGYQPFFFVHPIRLLQVGVKMDASFSTIRSKFENTLIQETYDLKIQMRSYIPGAYAYLTLNRFEIGGGVLYSYSSVKVSDDFFGYYDIWSGKNIGYEASMGFSSWQEHLVGFTMSVRYRYLQFEKLTDSYNRKVTYSDSQKNMPLNLSGLFVDAGLYFQFINLKRKSK